MKLLLESWRKYLTEAVGVEERNRLLDNDYEKVGEPKILPAPYRDIKTLTTYKRKDGEPISDEELKVFTDYDDELKKDLKNIMSTGFFTTTRTEDGMQLKIEYHRMTAG